MSNEKYNGWTNYETWRVHLEMFDGMEHEELLGWHEELHGMDRYSVGQYLKQYAEDYIEATTEESLARDWALAFLQPVDWYAIADHVMPEETEEV